MSQLSDAYLRSQLIATNARMSELIAQLYDSLPDEPGLMSGKTMSVHTMRLALRLAAMDAAGIGGVVDEVADNLVAAPRNERCPVTLYSQRDPRWRDQAYAGGVKFGTDGCYVTCVAMIASLAGYNDTPPVVAQKLHGVGCFNGAYLSNPERIPSAYPLLDYLGPFDVSQDGELRWHNTVADMDRVRRELEKHPVIMEVDYRPITAEFNQHFVVAENFTPDGDDILIADPWDGAATRLLERYSLHHDGWDLARAIYGLRLLVVEQVADD